MNYIQLQYITCITGYFCHYMILQVLHDIYALHPITTYYNYYMTLLLLHHITVYYNVLHKLNTITLYYRHYMTLLLLQALHSITLY